MLDELEPLLQPVHPENVLQTLAAVNLFSRFEAHEAVAIVLKEREVEDALFVYGFPTHTRPNTHRGYHRRSSVTSFISVSFPHHFLERICRPLKWFIVQSMRSPATGVSFTLAWQASCSHWLSEPFSFRIVFESISQ